MKYTKYFDQWFKIYFYKKYKIDFWEFYQDEFDKMNDKQKIKFLIKHLNSLLNKNERLSNRLVRVVRNHFKKGGILQ